MGRVLLFEPIRSNCTDTQMKKHPIKSVEKEISKPKKISVVPIGDRVLVRPITEEEKKGKNTFGIILPDSVEKEKSGEAVVLAVGDGKYEDGKLIPMRVKVGQTVLYSKYNYDEISVDGEDLYIIREDTILAIINN